MTRYTITGFQDGGKILDGCDIDSTEDLMCDAVALAELWLDEGFGRVLIHDANGVCRWDKRG